MGCSCSQWPLPRSRLWLMVVVRWFVPNSRREEGRERGAKRSEERGGHVEELRDWLKKADRESRENKGR